MPPGGDKLGALGRKIELAAWLRHRAAKPPRDYSAHGVYLTRAVNIGLPNYRNRRIRTPGVGPAANTTSKGRLGKAIHDARAAPRYLRELPYVLSTCSRNRGRKAEVETPNLRDLRPTAGRWGWGCVGVWGRACGGFAKRAANARNAKIVGVARGGPKCPTPGIEYSIARNSRAKITRMHRRRISHRR